MMIRKTSTVLRLAYLKAQKLLKVNRFKSAQIPLHYGSNWFSITDEFTRYMLSKEDFIKKYFSNTFCSDELFAQTILYSSPYYENNYYNSMDQTKPKGRYIDWHRGSPYTFRKQDLNELLDAKNCSFARKFDWDIDKDIVLLLEEELKRREKDEI